MIGSLAALPLPDMASADIARISNGLDPLREQLLRQRDIEVPVFPWPAPPKRLLRISAQLYNSLPQYEGLAAVLRKIFPPRKPK
jgi:isopenicillin-N epimerase